MRYLKLLFFKTLFFYFLFTQSGSAQTAIAPAGAGTSASPYQISSFENLYWIQQNSAHWDKHYVQTIDIDASVSSSWFSGAGFPTIGVTSPWFTGVYNGNGKTISNLYMNRTQTDYCALFGQLSGSNALIQNLGLVNLNYTFNSGLMVAGIVGRLANGAKIERCFSSGNITSNGHIGGIAGSPATNSLIEECWSSVEINSTITGSTERQIGGIAAWVTQTLIKDCYFSGSITWVGTNVRIGGIVGFLNGNFGPTSVSKSYSIGSFNGSTGSNNGAVIGRTFSTTSANDGVFFDNNLISLNGIGSQNTGFTGAVNGVSTSTMKTQSNYPLWDFTQIWGIDSSLNNGYPYLRQNSPPPDCNAFLPEQPPLSNGTYLVSSFKHLRWISENSSSWSADFIQTANINAFITSASCFNSGAGWSPIGNVSIKFTGSYNGNGHTITNLFMNRSGSAMALFGQTNGATIQQLGLIDPNVTITGSGFGLGSNTGSLVGLADNGTTISKCFASGGSVTAEGAGVGGLIGQLWNSSLTDAFAIVAVDGATDQYSAGLVGVNTSSSITNCYAAGSVALNQINFMGSTIDYSKGLTQNNGGTIVNSFYDVSATGQNTGGGSARTTSQMQQQANFTNWDFQCETVNGSNFIWGIDEANDYPVLSIFGFDQGCPFWTGSIDTDWNNGGNWNVGTKPGANQKVFISSLPANQPLISTNEVINLLVVESGASVTVNGTFSLTVADTILNNGIIIVEDSGSLIQTHAGSNSNWGTGTYIIKKSGYQQVNRYNVWSSPVVDTIKVWNVFAGTNLCDVYVFEPSTQSWKWPYPSGYQTTCMSSNVTFSASHVLAGMNGSMWAGRGYYVPGNGTQSTRTFNGNVNNGTITTPVALGPNPTGAPWSGSNWNLIGNPYPSPINANDFWQENALNNSRIIGALYFWNDNGTGSNYSENDYASWNTLGGVQGPNGGATPNGHIASGQGFWVIANSSTNVSFSNNMRSSVNNQFFGASEVFPRIWIDVAFDTLVKSQALIAFPEDGTNDHDALYDAPKLQSNQQVYLASRINTQDLVIQGLEPLRFTSTRKRVPLTFKTQLQGVHRIEMYNQDNMDRIAVYLHDAENDSLHPIQGSSYVFTPDSVGEYKERFALWFMHRDLDEHVGEIGINPGVDNPSTSIANANNERGFKVIARNEQIVVKSKGSSRIKHIVLTDMQGRTIREGDGKNGVRYELNTGRIATAVYFVRITDERGELSVEKVFIK